jgi:hypothetical protein
MFLPQEADYSTYHWNLDANAEGSPSTDAANASDDSQDSHDSEKVDLNIGTTVPGSPRSEGAILFGLLILICSNAISRLTVYLDQDSSRKRVAALCLPTLLDRCKTTVVRDCVALFLLLKKL